jgi:hypothetical protein
MSNTNTTTNDVNPPKVEKPTFVGKYFDDKKSFLEYFGFTDSKTASESIIGLCQSTSGGKSVGVSSPLYLQQTIDNDKLVMIMVIHNYKEPAPEIKGFVILYERPNNPTSVYLSLICSKVKGGGSYLLENLKEQFSGNYKYKKYNKIELEAVQGVGNVYLNREYQPDEITIDGYILMHLDLREQVNQLENKGFKDGNEGGDIGEVEYYVTRYGRPTSVIKGSLSEQLRRNIKNKPIPRTSSIKNKPINTTTSKIKTSTVNVENLVMIGKKHKGGKGRKTHKNGNKKRRITRRRR